MPEYLVLVVLIFVAAGLVLLVAPLVAGLFVRPHRPSPEKGEVYECGEQPVGTAWVQFDLRFYVVALLFVIFDVELAFFFPWAVVFGSASRAADESLPVAERVEAGANLQPQPGMIPGSGRVPAPEEMQGAKAGPRPDSATPPDPAAAKSLAWVAFADIMVFFGVLLVGFAYLWRRGDLEWVRSTAAQSGSVGAGVSEHHAAQPPPTAHTRTH